ncbi:MAG: glycosyltransferase [Clostridium sp.]|nr:glycosyltransferase [Prevotella sp.]MCM1429749.1 glycosyltransferase [Clostridium sp.]MCM1474936.1 glycosyltransferase [Muribaculaceae bacterium]
MAISVIINTHGATDNLQSIIDSLNGFDEVIICDISSDPKTVQIARDNNCRLLDLSDISNPTIEEARNYAIHSARSSWILVIDDDETVTPELRDYLTNFVKNPGDVSGIYIPRKNHVLNIWKRSSYPDFHMRFFKRDNVQWPVTPYSQAKVAGRSLKIPAGNTDLALVHAAPSITDLLTRINRHTSERVNRAPSRNVPLPVIVLKPIGKFLSTYIIRGAFRFGVSGFISAVNDALFDYVTLAKHHERSLK